MNQSNYQRQGPGETLATTNRGESQEETLDTTSNRGKGKLSIIQLREEKVYHKYRNNIFKAVDLYQLALGTGKTGHLTPMEPSRNHTRRV